MEAVQGTLSSMAGHPQVYPQNLLGFPLLTSALLLLTFPLRIGLDQEEGTSGEESLGRQQAAGAGSVRQERGEFQGRSRVLAAPGRAGLLCLCSSLEGEERCWNGQVVSRAQSCPGALPLLQLQLSGFSAL